MTGISNAGLGFQSSPYTLSHGLSRQDLEGGNKFNETNITEPYTYNNRGREFERWNKREKSRDPCCSAIPLYTHHLPFSSSFSLFFHLLFRALIPLLLVGYWKPSHRSLPYPCYTICSSVVLSIRYSTLPLSLLLSLLTPPPTPSSQTYCSARRVVRVPLRI